MSITLTSPGEVLSGVGQRARKLRLQANLTQAGLAARAGVSLGTLKLFERTGAASMRTAIGIAFALGAEQDFLPLFGPREARSIKDLIQKPSRKRGTVS